MRQCIAEQGRWPDASADVSPNELEEFHAHADVCPYHEEILRREFENDLRSVFRLARGLDNEGRILRGAELHSAVEKQERCRAEWETVGRNESPIRLISLYNGSRLIAGHGKISNYSYQMSLHDLDPLAGLQIKARCSDDSNEEVLLAFYALQGVKHSGEEFRLPLDNGYKIVLSVEQLVDKGFKVCFRYVENEGTQREVAEDETDASGPFVNYIAQTAQSSPWTGPRDFPWGGAQPVSWQIAALCGLLLMLYPLTQANTLLYHYWSGASAPAESRDGAKMLQARASVVSLQGNDTGGEPEIHEWKPSVTESQKNVEISYSARLKRNLKRVFAGRRKPERPEVIVHRSWSILQLSHEVNYDLKIKHTGNDPELAAKLPKVLAEWNRRKAREKAARMVQVAYGEEAAKQKADIEVNWMVTRLPESPSTIAVELRPQLDGSLRVPNCMLQFPSPKTGIGLNDDAVMNALDGVNIHLEGLSAIAKSWAAAAAPDVDSMPGSTSTEEDTGRVGGPSWRGDGVDAYRPVRAEEEEEDER